jgi:hypothetical protein
MDGRKDNSALLENSIWLFNILENICQYWTNIGKNLLYLEEEAKEMEKTTPVHLRDIVFASSEPSESRRISQWLKEDKVKLIAPRIYTGRMDLEPETLIRRNIFSILGHQYPGAVLSHRSALEFKPTEDGSLYLTYTYTKKVQLPGITLRLLEGRGPIEGDNAFMGELYVSQQPRAFLENLQQARRGKVSKVVPRADLESRLEKMLQVNGEKALNKLRDDARRIAAELGMEKEFDQLNRIISVLLTTHTSSVLRSPMAKARADGQPYDGGRIQLFETLWTALQQHVFPARSDRNVIGVAFANFAFFESYFSNYIEGTVFELQEAIQIIETERPIPTRDEDSHDILGTYKLASNRQEMRTIPSNGEHLLEVLRYRHRILLSARQRKNPGEFKVKNNYAGQTMFVEHELVRGTLIKGFDYYKTLTDPVAKAIFMMFLISEVHPFLDGNGRVARIMMNAELVHAGQSKIMIPTVYREDYIGALRRLTRQGDPGAFIGMMELAHHFSSNVYGENREEMRQYLDSCNAFFEDSEGRTLRIVPR